MFFLKIEKTKHRTIKYQNRILDISRGLKKKRGGGYFYKKSESDLKEKTTQLYHKVANIPIRRIYIPQRNPGRFFNLSGAR